LNPELFERFPLENNFFPIKPKLFPNLLQRLELQLSLFAFNFFPRWRKKWRESDFFSATAQPMLATVGGDPPTGLINSCCERPWFARCFFVLNTKTG
jgi:hypothetical protein